jgi:hypothetical protein
MRRAFQLLLAFLCFASCASTDTTTVSRRQKAESPSFFDRIADQLSTRECNVGRFICPYGFGPAGEACECTEPSGRVLTGRTVK